MRIETENIEVVLGDGEDAAKVIFAPMRVNNASRVRALMVAAKTDDEREASLLEYRQAIVDTCIKVENLFEDDTPITPEMLKTGELYQGTMTKIVSGYMLVTTKAASPEGAEAKNESSASDSQPA
jgi:hypothetical protein